LIEAFKFVHKPETKVAAEHLRDAILKENGCEEAVRAFHAHLPLSRMRSDLEPTFAACYRLKDFNLQVSRRVAQVLVVTDRIEESQLYVHPTRVWLSIHDNRVHVPFHGIIKHIRIAIMDIISDTTTGVKQAMHSDNWKRGAYSVVEGVSKGVGKGIGHLYIGCLSIYGELTDVLESAPYYYDPYR
jgi:hypothetical protein